MRAMGLAAGITLATLAGGLGAVAEPQSYAIDPDHTLVTFQVEHLGFSTTTGWFGDTTGTIVFDPDDPAASSVDVEIAVRSVGTNNAERDGWIASDAVLDAEAAPVIAFNSTGIEVTDDDTGRITGDLSMAGTTRPVTLDVTFNRIGENPLTKMQTVGFTATGSLERSDFGADGFVGPLGDTVSFRVDVEAIAQ